MLRLFRLVAAVRIAALVIARLAVLIIVVLLARMWLVGRRRASKSVGTG